jgi:hypothetical protein
LIEEKIDWAWKKGHRYGTILCKDPFARYHNITDQPFPMLADRIEQIRPTLPPTRSSNGAHTMARSLSIAQADRESVLESVLFPAFLTGRERAKRHLRRIAVPHQCHCATRQNWVLDCCCIAFRHASTFSFTCMEARLFFWWSGV